MAKIKKRHVASKLNAVEQLKAAGLRPTRQRLMLAQLLGCEHRHISAEALHKEAQQAGVSVSLATVYNTLHQFIRANLLREVMVASGRSYFDTNTGSHQHFFCEEDDTLIDIDEGAIAVAGVPAPPRGMKVDRVDVVIRIKRNQHRTNH